MWRGHRTQTPVTNSDFHCRGLPELLRLCSDSDRAHSQTEVAGLAPGPDLELLSWEGGAGAGEVLEQRGPDTTILSTHSSLPFRSVDLSTGLGIVLFPKNPQQTPCFHTISTVPLPGEISSWPCCAPSSGGLLFHSGGKL